MDSVLRSKIEGCCISVQEFTRLYYIAFDKRRHQIGQLYLDSGVFVFNGNGSNGPDQIQKFIQDLPISDHVLSTLDAQPIVDAAVGNQLSHIIQAGGTVKYTDIPTQPFQQTFLITEQNEKWKIVSDCYRLQDSLAMEM